MKTKILHVNGHACTFLILNLSRHDVILIRPHSKDPTNDGIRGRLWLNLRARKKKIVWRISAGTVLKTLCLYSRDILMKQIWMCPC